MLHFQILAEVVFASSHLSKDESEYRRIEVYPIIFKVNGGYTHINDIEDVTTIDKSLTVFRCSDTETVRRKTTKGSLILLDIEEHIKGETSYEKEGVEVKHTESGFSVNYITGISDTELVNLFENDIISEKKLNIYFQKNRVIELI